MACLPPWMMSSGGARRASTGRQSLADAAGECAHAWKARIHLLWLCATRPLPAQVLTLLVLHGVTSTPRPCELTCMRLRCSSWSASRTCPTKQRMECTPPDVHAAAKAMQVVPGKGPPSQHHSAHAWPLLLKSRMIGCRCACTPTRHTTHRGTESKPSSLQREPVKQQISTRVW